MSGTAAALPQLQVLFGTAGDASAAIELPVLSGPAMEALFPAVAPAGTAGGFALWGDDAWLVGHASAPAGRRLEESTFALYAALIEAARGHHLARIWNYVPAINEGGDGGLENYHLFCRGRARAFEAGFGPGFKRRVPSASAVGSRGSRLTVVFAASSHPARHLENPWQVPAYDYPQDHGPRSPSFARATVVPDGAGRHAVFISGTSAIRGHHTVAAGETSPQIECTLENLQEISRICGLGTDVGAGRAQVRHFKVYARHAADLPRLESALRGRFTRDDDRVVYLRADICRRELNVEVEVSVFGATLEERSPMGGDRS